jgi:tetraacyldisaccharide 4'-kinase
MLKENIDKEIKEHMYYLPIEIAFIENEGDFKDKIFSHIENEKFKL